MKTRRHHNNKGTRKIRRGKTWIEVREMARRLGIPFNQGRIPDCKCGAPLMSFMTECELCWAQRLTPKQ